MQFACSCSISTWNILCGNILEVVEGHLYERAWFEIWLWNVPMLLFITTFFMVIYYSWRRGLQFTCTRLNTTTRICTIFLLFLFHIWMGYLVSLSVFLVYWDKILQCYKQQRKVSKKRRATSSRKYVILPESARHCLALFHANLSKNSKKFDHLV